MPRMLKEPLFAATGYWSLLPSRESKKVPEPCCCGHGDVGIPVRHRARSRSRCAG